MKSNKGELSPLVGALLGLMMAVVIGLSVAIPAIQSTMTTATTLSSNSQTNVAAGKGTTLTLAYGDLVADTFTVTAANNTDVYTITSSNYTITLGSPAVPATVAWSSSNNASFTHANVSYSYYPGTYIRSPAVITLLNLLPLFIVLILLIGAVALVKF
jgi:hypothetical protein